MVIAIKIFDIQIEKDFILLVRINYVAVLIIIVFVGVLCLFARKLTKKTLFTKSIQINEMKLGIGKNSSVTLIYNTKEREVAYKLWVEMSTRKIGLSLDIENDVITEVYDSWYDFFKIARELMKEIPVNNGRDVIRLTELTERVLNEELRPHLTKWQARYRKWYNKAAGNDDRDPQTVQKDYERYNELTKDIINTNNRMIEFKNVLWEIAMKKE